MCAENSSRRYIEICDATPVTDRTGPEFNFKNLEVLQRINFLVNKYMIPNDDDPFFDFHNPGSDIGDCEEYVYAKLLILSGKKLKGKLKEIVAPTKTFNPSFLRPTFVYQLAKDNAGNDVKIGHMVLSVYLYDKIRDKFVTVILDNLKGDIYLPRNGGHIQIIAVLDPSTKRFLEVKPVLSHKPVLVRQRQ